MHPFRRVGDGRESLLDAQERALISQVVGDCAALLTLGQENLLQADEAFADGIDPGAGPEDAAQSGAGRFSAAPAERGRGAPREEDVLAALDFDVSLSDEPPAGGEDGQPYADPALARLLPPASTSDAEVAAEFRRLSEADLRKEKLRRLLAVFDELQSPSGDYGAVRIAANQEGVWLAALTDVRLVLGARLGLRTDADADRLEAVVHGDGPVPPRSTGRAQDDSGAAADLDPDTERLMASVYLALTWWQESLLQSFGP